MALGNLAGAGHRTLYVSGEESTQQVRLRAQRLAGSALAVPVIAENDLQTVLATLESEQPEVCVIDSVQTVAAAELTGVAGSVGQVREVAGAIVAVAKRRGIAVILVGHVTKDGGLAGPRVLEHLVDCVLQFEGERERSYRTLRAIKNRFGSTNEAGVFEMHQGGLIEVLDASARFVGGATGAPGSIVLAAMEGARPLLVEVQALVSQSELVPPRRVVNGIDRNRLALVLAVLARHGGVPLGNKDVFVNVVGGVRIDEPGADLAVALAVAGAARGLALGRPGATAPVAAFGELGLTGEVRWVGHPERRIAEARKFGLDPILAPPGSGARDSPTLRAALGGVLGTGRVKSVAQRADPREQPPGRDACQPPNPASTRPGPDRSPPTDTTGSTAKLALKAPREPPGARPPTPRTPPVSPGPASPPGGCQPPQTEYFQVVLNGR
jgi:DNA repair protein RadA/Sms